MADFFAYFSRRYMRDRDRFSGNIVLPMGPYLSTIREHVPIWQRGAFKFSYTEMGHIDDMPDFDSSFWGPRDAPIRSD
jgi:hypothetical protein